MTDTNNPTIFISYSRRQLYFAESLALHLQKEGLDVWFDLQQLQAGEVWADGLKDGIQDAGALVLVVSRASLASPYVEDEWRGAIKKGRKLVLVICEVVDLPEALQGLPTFDFRTGFHKNLHDIVIYLKGEADPRYDKLPKPNRLKVTSKMPSVIWAILIAQFSLLIGTILVLLFHVTIYPAREIFGNIGPSFLVLTFIFFGLGLWHGSSFLRHKQTYKKVKRSVLLSTILFIPTFYVVAIMISSEKSEISDIHNILLHIILFIIVAFNFIVYFFVLRRSAGFLRWMQPEEGLQKLRRKVHKPLIAKEKFDVDFNSEPANKSVSYTIHNDPADQPLANWIRNYFKKVGHKLVPLDKNPQHHIAILSNRSSQAWVQEVTNSYAGRLVYVVVSTIEFKESLKETGRYQWIDARNLNHRDIVSLAKSLGDKTAWKREAALEATPDKIDRWEIPSGIKLLNTMLEIFGVYVLVFGISNFLPSGEGDSISHTKYAILLIVVGFISFGLVAKGLIQRKVPVLVLYGIILLNLILVSYFGNIVLFEGLQDKKWLLLVITLPILVFSAMDGRFWLPTFSRPNNDEVGVHKKIVRAFWKKRIILVSVWIIVITGFVIWADNLKPI